MKNETEVVVEPGRQDIVVTRVFDAPRDVVFKAITDASLVPSWWGPSRYETIVDRHDVRPGGSWRYINRAADGTDYAFNGVFHDVSGPGRIVQTFEFEGAPGHVSLETFELDDLGDRTRYRSVSVFQSVEDRDAMVRTDMESGLRETLDRLAEVVDNL